MITSSNTRIPILGLAAILALTSALPAAAQDAQLVYDFSIHPLEGGQPDFGLPFHVAASPDGRHVYVTTITPLTALHTFARRDGTLELVDSIPAGEDGIEFSSTGLEITDDGAYVLLASFTPGHVLVFRRDRSSGLLEHVQTLTVEGMDNVDGVSASGEGVLVWGIGVEGEVTVAYFVESSKKTATTDAGKVLQTGQFRRDRLWGGGARVTDGYLGDYGYVLVRRDDIAVGEFPGLSSCTVSLDAISELLERPDVQRIAKAFAYFEDPTRPLVNLHLEDGTVVAIEVDLDSCELTMVRLLPPPGEAIEIGPDFGATRSVPGPDGRSTTFEFAGWEDVTGRTILWNRVELDEGEAGTSGEISLKGLVEIPQGVEIGRALDLSVSDPTLPGDGNKALESGVGEAYLYTTSPSPAGIHAFRLTTETSGCLPGPGTLCLNGGRFAVRAGYTTPQGQSGEARVVQLTSDTGYMSFFDDDNVEAVIKVLDGCGVNGRFWIFAAGLTDVEVELTVTDTVSGEVQTYTNPQGTPFAPIQDTSAFAGCQAAAPGWTPPALAEAAAGPDGEVLQACSEDDRSLCLNDGRFRVSAAWETAQGASGDGRAVALTADTGYFWFFDDDNVEVVVKVLGACGVNQRYWVFAGGLTDVRVDITVEDTDSGEVRTFTNPQGQAFMPVQDTGAFDTCP